MKHIYIFFFIALVAITGCSVYKNSPTPDDVYYSPGTPAQTAASSDNNNYYSSPNDNYVQMRVQDPDRWSYFDDYNYDYYGGYSGLGYGSPYSMGLGLGFGYGPWMGGFGYYSPFSYWNSYYSWNNFYNPYYGGIVYVNGKNFTAPAYTRLSTFNPAAYQGRYFTDRPSASSRYYNSNAPGNNAAQNLRRSYNNPSYNNFNRPTFNSQPVRTAPSGFGGGGGGGFRGGGGSRPGR